MFRLRRCVRYKNVFLWMAGEPYRRFVAARIPRPGHSTGKVTVTARRVKRHQGATVLLDKVSDAAGTALAHGAPTMSNTSFASATHLWATDARSSPL